MRFPCALNYAKLYPFRENGKYYKLSKKVNPLGKYKYLSDSSVAKVLETRCQIISFSQYKYLLSQTLGLRYVKAREVNVT